LKKLHEVCYTTCKIDKSFGQGATDRPLSAKVTVLSPPHFPCVPT